MLVNSNRERLVNAIIFFAANTKKLGKVKLFKLLYLLDFEHFKLTGRSVTGLPYYAWEMGPVPQPLYKEWKHPSPDLAAAVDIVTTPVLKFFRDEVVPKVAFDPSPFTKRQLDLLQGLAKAYGDKNAEQMVNATHDEFGPWREVWQDGRGKHQTIPYEMVLDPNDPEDRQLLEGAHEHASIVRQQGYR